MRYIQKNKIKLLSGFIAFAMVIGLLSGVGVYTKSNTVKVNAEENTTEVTTTVPVTTAKPKPKKKKIKVIKLKKPKIKVRKYKKTKVKVTWKKVKKAKKYEVYRSVKGKSFTKVKTTKKRKYLDKKTKRGNSYKYKVVAVAKSSGRTFKSKASKAKKIAIPKIKKSTADVVICGECFVEGMKLYAKKYVPSRTKLVYKVGLSTYGVLNTNYISYRGKTVTALERVAYYKPKVVYFLVGMNEASGNVSAIVNNYKKIVKLLKKVKPDIKVVLMALPPVGRNHSSGFASNPKINKVNKAYKKFASKTPNVYFYNGYRSLITDGAGYLKGSANGGDGGHWSARATIKVVKALNKHVKQFLN